MTMYVKNYSIFKSVCLVIHSDIHFISSPEPKAQGELIAALERLEKSP